MLSTAGKRKCSGDIIMCALETGSVPHAPPAAHATGGPQPSAPSGERPHKGRLGRLLLVILLVGLAAGAGYIFKVGLANALHDGQRLAAYVERYVPTRAEPVARSSEPVEPAAISPWDGFVRVKTDDAKAIGLLIVTVEAQVEPIKLPLMGRTDYDPNTLSKIRPRFDTLVERVRAELGQKVKKGDPLVDLFSTDLAAAKNDFQTAFVQWQHDLRLLKMREKLYGEKAISQQQLVDTLNDESKSRLAYTTSKEKLLVFGVPEDQIDPLLKNLGDQSVPSELHAISDKARMTRLSPVEGIVIQRDAVVGNLYDNNDVLMVIAPLDHLFVWVNVYEADQARVAMNQEMEIRFPYLDKTEPGKVEYVANEVSKDTRAIKIRASIKNTDGNLKADMLVRATLKIPAERGHTVIPRLAMVVMNGNEYAFVQKEASDSPEVLQFERRQLVVAEERDDHVVVKTGLKPGEHVASNGSLVLAQLYEDQQMVATGMPLK
jgi:cobalt-zinc-cadmium efflux system membrane fusion protein